MDFPPRLAQDWAGKEAAGRFMQRNKAGIRLRVNGRLATGLAVACLLLFSPPIAHGAPFCGYATIPGVEFEFSPLSEPLRKFGYHAWRKKPSFKAPPLAYQPYVGRRGKLLDRRIHKGITFYFIAVLESCEKVYVEGGTDIHPKSLRDIEEDGDIRLLIR